MQYIKEEISKELYDQAKNVPYPMNKSFFDIPIEWECGYGYYGCAVSYDMDTKKYYAIHTIGSSCD